MQFRKILLAGALASSTFTSACFQIGPRSVALGRTEYNVAIQDTNSEQLLLNLVRLRYREAPYFLGVASVSQSLEGSITGTASGSFPQGMRDTFGLSLEPSYVEKPSITYTPLQGEAFVRQLLSPLEYENLALLLNSGWSIARVMRLMVQEMNGLKNAPSASGPTPSFAPEYREFRRAVEFLRQLEIRGEARLVLLEDNGERVFALHIDPSANDTEEAAEFRKLMGLDAGRSEYPIGPMGGANRIAIVPRPFISSLFYLSQCVEVPEEHRERGMVTITADGDSEFDWGQVTDGLMSIKSTKSGREARRNAIRVKYRGYWFYVPDNDLSAKSTFFLLDEVLALKAGNTPSMAPILTLPVAR